MLNKKILFVDKPKGITSFDVIRQLRKKLGVKKIGHSGTLDPLASGLMIVGVGDGTKKLSEYIKLDKVYVVDILLGERRTTGDMEGDIIEETEVVNLDIVKVKKIANDMIGIHKLPVPIYSAIKIKGEPLYKKARKGKQITPPKKTKMRYTCRFV